MPLTVILQFKKVARLTSDLPTLISALRHSTKLQLSPDDSALRRIQPLPPYDQLRDAHRSLFVDHLPPSSTLKSVKKLFSVFGKVTYVLRADQITSASHLNASPRQSPLIAPVSPGVREGGGGMPRLSLTSPAGLSGSLIVPLGTASDSVDGVFTSAFVQFETPSSMETAVELIHAQQAAHRAAKANGHSSSPGLSARRLMDHKAAGSPSLSSRALGQAGGDRGPSPVPHINDVIILSPQIRRGGAMSSPPLVALPPSAAGSGSADNPIPILDLGGGGAHQQSRPSTPNTPSSPPHTTVDPPTPLPAVFLTVSVQTKGDFLQHLEEKADKAPEAEKERPPRADSIIKPVKKDSSNWRRSTDPTGVLSFPDHPPPSPSPTLPDAPRSSEHFADGDPLVLRKKEEAHRKAREEEAERDRERERDKEFRRQHLGARNQERAAAKEAQAHKALEKAREDDGIIHISPRPSPILRPTPSPILISHSPMLAAGGAGHSPNLSSLSLSPSPSQPPPLELAKPRFSLTKRTSIVAATVASHFALGPDAPDSRGFNGRGRGKILPLSMAGSAPPPLHPVGPPPLH